MQKMNTFASIFGNLAYVDLIIPGLTFMDNLGFLPTTYTHRSMYHFNFSAANNHCAVLMYFEIILFLLEPMLDSQSYLPQMTFLTQQQNYSTKVFE